MLLKYIDQLCYSETALKHGIYNTPQDPEVLKNLEALECKILMPVFQHFSGTPDITSGYRCPELNALVGGEKSSQHCLGEAVDFGILDTDIFEIASWIEQNLEFDHLILEKYTAANLNTGWVHCSYRRNAPNHHKVQTYDGVQYHEGVIKVPLRG